MRATAMLISCRARADSARQPSSKHAGTPTRHVSSWTSSGRQQHVLLQPVDLPLADIFTDFLVELAPGLPGPVLHQLGGHARADTRDQQKLLALAGIQIDLHKGFA